MVDVKVRRWVVVLVEEEKEEEKGEFVAALVVLC